MIKLLLFFVCGGCCAMQQNSSPKSPREQLDTCVAMQSTSKSSPEQIRYAQALELENRKTERATVVAMRIYAELNRPMPQALYRDAIIRCAAFLKTVQDNNPQQ